MKYMYQCNGKEQFTEIFKSRTPLEIKKKWNHILKGHNVYLGALTQNNQCQDILQSQISHCLK